MTGERNGNAQWREATILIRVDILAQANEEGIDISSECNRALAARLGIDYFQQKNPDLRQGRPIIIAKDPPLSGTGSDGRPRDLLPVLNAEDPRAPAHVLKIKREPVHAAKALQPAKPAAGGKKKAEREPPLVTQQPPVKPPAPPKAADKKKPLAKKGKEDRIRQFLEKTIIRTESGGDCRIAKDELYQIFARFCRASSRNRGAVPDKRAFAIALKNRFVMEDSVTDGVHFWNNVRLR